MMAAKAFAHLRVDGLERRLIDAGRGEEDRTVRVEICRALSRGEPEAVQPFLLEAAGKADAAAVRLAAVRSLGKVGDTRAAAVLLGLLDTEQDPETRVQLHASSKQILARVGSQGG